MKKFLLITVSLALTVVTIPTTADAAVWHSSAIPRHLRGYWHAKANPRQGVHINKHSIHYSGEKNVKVKWRYAGNHRYHFKYKRSQGFTITMHYYTAHKMTLNSYWHDYYK